MILSLSLSYRLKRHGNDVTIVTRPLPNPHPTQQQCLIGCGYSVSWWVSRVGYAGHVSQNAVIHNEQQTTNFSGARRRDCCICRLPLLFVDSLNCFACCSLLRCLLPSSLSLSAALSASLVRSSSFIVQHLDTYGHIIPNQCRRLASNKRPPPPLPSSTVRLTRHADRMY